MNIRTLRHLYFIIMLCSLFSLIGAQTDEHTPPPTPSVSMLQIGFINETALYYHLPLNEDLSLKSGLSASWILNESDNGTGTVNYFTNGIPEQRKYTEGSINSSLEFGASSLAMFTMKRFELVQLSLGAGPSVLYSVQRYSSNNRSYTDTTFDRYGSESQYTTVGIGPSVSALFSANVYGSVFITAEYSVTAYYCWYSENYNSRNEYKSPYSSTVTYNRSNSEEESNIWKIRLSSVRVGLMFGL